MIIDCDMCKKPFGSFDRTDGDDFGFFYHCPDCMTEFKQKQMLQLAKDGELPDGDRECPECEGGFAETAIIGDVCMYCYGGMDRE